MPRTQNAEHTGDDPKKKSMQTPGKDEDSFRTTRSAGQRYPGGLNKSGSPGPTPGKAEGVEDPEEDGNE